MFQKNKDKPVEGLDQLVSDEKLQSSLVLYFYSPNCGPCRTMTPRIDRLVGEGSNIEKINVLEHKEFAVKVGVVGLPFVILVEQGKLKRTILGTTSERRIRNMLSQTGEQTQAA